MVKGVLIFICGAGVGSSVTYIIMKKKCDERINKDLEENRRHYQEKIEKVEKERDTAEYKGMVKGLGYNRDVQGPGYESADEMYEDAKEALKHIPYDKMSQKEVKDRVKDIQEKVVIMDSPKEDYPDEPIVISEDQYAEDELYFEKIEAELYLGDMALVAENDDLLNIDDTVGFDILERFMDGPDDILYVRNPHLSTDYLITKVGGEYSSIMGLGGDDDE